MSEQAEKKYPYGLTESDMLLLRAIMESPANVVLRKIIKGESDKVLAQLRLEGESKEIYRLQGRIIGTEALANIIYALGSQQVAKEKKANKP